jgi:hypothetical protein
VQIIGSYQDDGFVHLKNLITSEVARAFLQMLKQDMGDGAIPLSGVTDYPNLLHRPAFELYGHHYKPMLCFLWGLTPTISAIVGRDLLPTYNYLRIYREGDVCRVHSDRQSCEHSISLTLDYSDGAEWDLEIGKIRQEKPTSKVTKDFDGEPSQSISMQVGDAVLYRGVQLRHGRTRPNPNQWSAHLFLHWVDRIGTYADHAFDGNMDRSPVNFSFG